MRVTQGLPNKSENQPEKQNKQTNKQIHNFITSQNKTWEAL